MIEHHFGLKGASVLVTRYLLLTRDAVTDIVQRHGMGAIYGPAGLGKTFAIARAVEAIKVPVVRVPFETRPTEREVGRRLLGQITGVPPQGTRFTIRDALLPILSERPRLIIIGEAQNLNKDCFEYLRLLHDDQHTKFSLLFDGGHGCWHVLSRERMLLSRIQRAVEFDDLSEGDVLALIPTYHGIFKGVEPDLVRLIDDRFAAGNLRNWALFTVTAADICKASKTIHVSRDIALDAIARIGR